MKLLIPIALMLLLTACSTSPLEQRREHQRDVNKHLSEASTYTNGPFDSRYDVSGSDGIHARAVGVATGTNKTNVRSMARTAAKFNLINSGPTEFKSMVQRAIGNTLGRDGEYNKIDTSVTEVHALRGIEINQRDVECKSVSTPIEGFDYDRTIECRAIAKVSLVNLNKAYDFTLEHKYGIKEKSTVEKILNQQLYQKVVRPTAPITKK